MARMVVVMFKDEANAEKFAKELNEGKMYYSSPIDGCEEQIDAKALAVVKPPTIANKPFNFETLEAGEDEIYRG